jgi:hypothetical protein
MPLPEEARIRYYQFIGNQIYLKKGITDFKSFGIRVAKD